MQSQRRLKRVVTFVSDIQQLTEYNLAYQVSRGTRRSLLKEIELCSSVNSIKQCSPLTTLNWLDTIHYGAPEPLTFSGQEVYKNQKSSNLQFHMVILMAMEHPIFLATMWMLSKILLQQTRLH